MLLRVTRAQMDAVVVTAGPDHPNLDVVPGGGFRRGITLVESQSETLVMRCMGCLFDHNFVQTAARY